MKKFVIAAIMLFAVSVNAQVVQSGKSFKAVPKEKSASSKMDTVVTQYTWEDNKGVVHPIILNKKICAAYYWKGGSHPRDYFRYNLRSISETICKEYGLEYKPTKKEKENEANK